MITFLPDHVRDGLRRVLSQFDKSPKLRGIVAATLNQVQEIEGVVFDLFFSRTIDGASKGQLEVIGRVVGEPRDGLNDAEYRRFLKVRIAVNFSMGERFRIAKIVSLATGSDDIHFQPNYPAAFSVSYTVTAALADSVRARILRLLEESTASGVNFSLVEAGDDYFGFDEDDEALGFDDGVFAELL